MPDINQASQPLGGEEVMPNIGRVNRHGTATGLSMNSFKACDRSSCIVANAGAVGAVRSKT